MASSMMKSTWCRTRPIGDQTSTVKKSAAARLFQWARRNCRQVVLRCAAGSIPCRTQKDAAVRHFRGPVLVQANHHVARRFEEHNESLYLEDEDEELGTVFEDSSGRAATLETTLGQCGSAGSFEEVAGALDEYPVCHEESYQQMVFCPRTGDVRVWRLVE